MIFLTGSPLQVTARQSNPFLESGDFMAKPTKDNWRWIALTVLGTAMALKEVVEVLKMFF